MTPLKQLESWSSAKRLLLMVVRWRGLPLRTLYLGRLFCNPVLMKTAIFSPGAGMDGHSPGVTTLSIELAQADITFGPASTDEAAIVRIVQAGRDGEDYIELSRPVKLG